MTKKDAIELLRFANAAQKARIEDPEWTSAYLHLAILMALSSGMTWDEIQERAHVQMSFGSAFHLVEKYENRWEAAVKEQEAYYEKAGSDQCF